MNRYAAVGNAIRGLVAVLLLVPSTAPVVVAQNVEQVAHVEPVGPPMQALEIAVQDMKTKQKLEPVGPGGVIRLAPGDVVRLRMVSLPAERHRAPRYPSTRFAAVATNGLIALSKTDIEGGSTLVTALGGHGSGTATLSYELMESVNISPDLHKGTLTVEIVVPPPEVVAPPEVVPPPAPKPRGATLYRDADFRGTSETFYKDERDLSRTRIGKDAVTSVRVDPGCRVKLFEHDNYQGTFAVLSRDLDAMHGTAIGNDTASSLMVRCSDEDDWGPGWGVNAPGSGPGAASRRGVTLFDRTDYSGTSESFYEDQSDLRYSRIGDNAASSIEVERGCEVELYEEPGYSGRRTVLTEDLDDLYDARVGDNNVSSLRITCDF